MQESIMLLGFLLNQRYMKNDIVKSNYDPETRRIIPSSDKHKDQMLVEGEEQVKESGTNICINIDTWGRGCS